MTKAPTKEQLHRQVLALERQNRKYVKRIAELTAELEARTAVSVALMRKDSKPKHVTPLPANEYGPFPWEPKQ